MRTGVNAHGGLRGPAESSRRRVPGYVLEAELGRGASGEVWRARVAATGAAVAVKWVPLTGPEQARAARAEAAMLQTLDHPHLVRLHDVVPVRDALALVLDLAEGGTLADLVAARGTIAPGEAVAAMSGVAAALTVAHAAGVVHGDVTPANVLFTEIALPLLADLGVARIIGERRPARTTPAFVDPIVAIGGVPSPSSDVFMAAGTTLFALTGQALWPGETAEDALAYAGAGRLDVETRLADHRVPSAIARVLRVALDLDPARRGTAAGFALELRHAAEPCAIELTAGRARGGVGASTGGRASSADPVPSPGSVPGRPVRPSASGRPAPRHRAPVARPSAGELPPGRGARSVLAPRAKLSWRGLVAATARGRASGPSASRATGARAHGSSKQGAVAADEPSGHEPRHTAAPAAPVRARRAAPTAGGAVAASDDRARPSFARPVVRPAVDTPALASAPSAAASAARSGAGRSHALAEPSSPGAPADRSIGVGPGAGSALTHGVRARPVALRLPRPTRRQRVVRTAVLAAVVVALSVGAAVALRAWLGRGRPAVAAPAVPAAASSTHRVESSAAPASMVESSLAVLRQLAAIRARAFATRDTALLTDVYLPGPLLAADQALLTRIVPAGCGLVGADTTYRVVSATGDGERRVVVATASVGASRLLCAGRVSGEAAESPATGMRIELRTGAPGGWRIAALQLT